MPVDIGDQRAAAGICYVYFGLEALAQPVGEQTRGVANGEVRRGHRKVW